MNDIRPIHSAEDYAAALQEIDRFFSAKRNTPGGDRLGVFVALAFGVVFGFVWSLLRRRFKE